MIIVADRGLNRKLHLEAITQKGYGYIVASRLKKLPTDLTEKILDPPGYIEVSSPDGNLEEGFRYQVFPYEKRGKAGKNPVTLSERLIVTSSSRRAQKEASDRERLIAKAHQFLENPSTVSASFPRGGKRYLASLSKEPHHWVLNQDLIDHDARFDGYQGIETSEKNLSPQEVIQAYHTLGTIEESSRIMKSTLEVRPIFPWTPRRIRGHFAVCFLAFLLERILERSLQGAGIPASPETIRETLNSLQVAKVDIDHQPYYLKMKGNPPRSKDPSTP